MIAANGSQAQVTEFRRFVVERGKYMLEFTRYIGNPCGYGNCMRPDCEKCKFYKPTVFKIRVPKFVIKVLYAIDCWQMRH